MCCPVKRSCLGLCNCQSHKQTHTHTQTHTRGEQINLWLRNKSTETRRDKKIIYSNGCRVHSNMNASVGATDLFISLLKIDILLHRDMKSFWAENYSWAAAAAVVCSAYVCAYVCLCDILRFLPKVKPNCRLHHSSCEALSWGISSLLLSLQQTGFYNALMIDPHLPAPSLPLFIAMGFKQKVLA